MSPLISPKLERETGIEPATNSLEGCDSTTELLPPTFRSGPCRFLRSTSAGKPATLSRLPAEAASEANVRRRMVAREGFEPSKAHGRQIYSLLRLTASLPRHKWTACVPFPSHKIGAGEGI